MADPRLLVLGVGDAFSSRYYSTALVVEAEGEYLLIDCPHPIRKLLRDASQSSGVPLDVGAVRAIALTHLHADHSSGLEIFGFYARFVLGRRVPLLAHPVVSEHLWDGHLRAAMGVALQGPGQPPERRQLDDFFLLEPLDEARGVRCGPFTIHCRRTTHSVPTTALFIEMGGRSLGYSADTAFDPGLIDWLSGADLVVHEATRGFLHTPYEKLAALPPGLRSKMRLIHYPDDFDVAGSVITPLRQGQCYPIEPADTRGAN